MKFDPAKSVLHHQGGDEIKLNDEGFLLSSGTFFAENERRYSWTYGGKEPGEV
jgi:hypothetical protein